MKSATTTITTTTTVALTALWLCACGGTGSIDDSDAPTCSDAVDACNTFVSGFCDKEAACGGLDHASCVAVWKDAGYDCERAATFQGDASACVASFEPTSCTAFEDPSAPFLDTDACNAFDVGTGNNLCSETSPSTGNDTSSSGSGSCQGQAPSCSARDKYSCNEVLGCYVDGDYCSGVALRCDEMAADQCGQQYGCSIG